MLDAVAQMPFVDTLELAVVLGEVHAMVHRTLSGLLADGIAVRVNIGTVHLGVERRVMARSIGEMAAAPGFATPSEFVCASGVATNG